MKKLTALAIALAIFLSSSAFALPISRDLKTINRIDKLVVDSSRMVVLETNIDIISASIVVSKLRKLDDKKSAPITLVLDSNGGSIDSGIEIIKAMESLQTPLQCLIDDKAYSMAAMISAYCPKLYAYKFSSIMFHEASYGARGTETQVKTITRMIQAMLHDLKVDVAKKMGITMEEFAHRMHDEWWMTGQEAAQIGFVGTIVDKIVYKRPRDDERNLILVITEKLRKFFPAHNK